MFSIWFFATIDTIPTGWKMKQKQKQKQKEKNQTENKLTTENWFCFPANRRCWSVLHLHTWFWNELFMMKLKQKVADKWGPFYFNRIDLILALRLQNLFETITTSRRCNI